MRLSGKRAGTGRRTAVVGTLAASVAVLAGCGGGDEAAAGGGTTITLAGPNQWSTDADSFGPAWEQLVADFEGETGVAVETTVLPIDQFAQTLSTQLSAGTAPDLVFNQAPHEPYMVHALDDYLGEPNPFADSDDPWIDGFLPEYYGFDVTKALNAEGSIEYVPFNLVATGLFVNADAFEDAGLTAPITGWADFIDACGTLKEAGYTPLAMDNGDLGLGWTVQTMSNMLFAKYYEDLNVYAPDGTEGTSEQLTPKDWARAILSGEVSATETPEVQATLELLKQLFESCVTENWSGVTPSGGAVIGLDQFAAGDAAMAWGVNFGYSALQDVDFELSSMPFPTIGEQVTPVSTGFEAQYGASIGGTSYMIPAGVEGEQLDAAVQFLQFVSTPDRIEPWLQATGGIPAVEGAEADEGVAGFAEGAWGEQMLTNGMPTGPVGTTIQSLYDGFLLGERDMASQLAYLQERWVAAQRQAVEDNGWESEPWAAG